MIEKIITVNVKAVGDTKALKVIADLKKGMSELTDETEDLKKEQKDAQKTTQKEVSKSTDKIKEQAEATEGTTDKIKEQTEAIKKSRNPLKKLGTGFKALGTSIKLAGIGLFVGFLIGMQKAFSRNQKVLDAFNTIAETGSIIFSQLASAVVRIYEAVVKSKDNFNGLSKVLSSLLTIGLAPLKKGFYAIKGALLATQLAWEKSIFGGKDEGKILSLQKSLDDTKEKLLNISEETITASKDLVNNFTDAVGEIVNIGKIAGKEFEKVDLKAASSLAKSIVASKKRAELAAAEQTLLLEKYDQRAEKLRQIRDEERFSIKDRKAANDELLKVLSEQEKVMVGQAEQQVYLAQLNLKKNNTIENQAALTEALANKQGVLAQVEGFRSEQKANDLALDREITALKDEIKTAEAATEAERRQLELDETAKHYEALIEKAKKNNIDTIDLEKAKKEALDLLKQEYKDEDEAIAADAATKKSEKAAADAAAEEKEEQERRARRDETFDHAVSLVGAETRLGKVLLAAKKLIQAQEFVMDAIDEVREAKAIAKKAKNAVTNVSIKAAETGVETKASIGKAVNAAPPPFNIPFIVSAVGTAVGVISAVKAAVSATKSAAAAAGGGGGGVSTPSAPKLPPSRPPSFNIVGASGTNQLADVINTRSGEQTSAIEGSINSQTQVIQEGQEGQTAPIKAYVVSDEVTSMQGLERNAQEETGL